MRGIDNLGEHLIEICSIPTSTTQTFADGLALVKTYFDALPDFDKRCSYLRIGSYNYPLCYMGGGYSGNWTDANYFYAVAVMLNRSEYSWIRTRKSDLSRTYTDLSANVRSQVIALYVKK